MMQINPTHFDDFETIITRRICDYLGQLQDRLTGTSVVLAGLLIEFVIDDFECLVKALDEHIQQARDSDPNTRELQV